MERWLWWLTNFVLTIVFGPDTEPAYHGTYVISDILFLGRRYDGIGAISGGGATSKLLVNYPEKERDEILDYLFKPNFGASLQILKVEIGGDSQSTDGTESSHMHSRDDLNLQRGYEWWLMKEAKKRNPSILLYGLPWVWPGWLGGDDLDPFSKVTDTVNYTLNWIVGAKTEHNLTIDYIGIWNERPYNVWYIKSLRRALNRRGFAHVRIVAADAEWDIVPNLRNDTRLRKSVDVIGVHYPGATAPMAAFDLGMTLWASEEFSALNDLAGAGCWARVLSESYRDGLLTSVIAWHLVSSFYPALPYHDSGLMSASQPWSGHYSVQAPIWVSAHFTQFMEPGWYYFPHGLGVDTLTANGTLLTLTNPDLTDLTIIIVTMDPAFAHCFYHMPFYTIAPQTAEFFLTGSFDAITQLNVWYSRLDPTGENTVLFEKQEPIQVVDGKFNLTLGVNEIYTLTTLPGGQKGRHDEPPPSAPFPANYEDDFESYVVHQDPFNLVAQAGAFEVVALPEPEIETHMVQCNLTAHFTGNLTTLSDVTNGTCNLNGSEIDDITALNMNKTTENREEHVAQDDNTTVNSTDMNIVNKTRPQQPHRTGHAICQMVPEPPVDTCRPERMPRPIALIGDFAWTDVSVEADFLVPSTSVAGGVFVGTRVNHGGCRTMYANGTFLWAFPEEQRLMLTANASGSAVYGNYSADLWLDHWHTLRLDVKGTSARGYVDGEHIFSEVISLEGSSHGFVALGVDTFGPAFFDNLRLINGTGSDEGSGFDPR